MNGAFKHPLRVGVRLAWLVGEMIWIAVNYIPRVVLRSDSSGLAAKARWLHWGCRRVLRIFQLKVTAAGPVPQRGLLVSNHLSYLDILVFSALTPAVFVAKREVRGWPVFGLFARLAGTVFVDRRRRLQASASADAVQAVLDDGGLAVLFPEGTTSNGRQVLPFRGALLEPAVRYGHRISAGAIQYELLNGDVEEEICYWKDMTLLPHLLNLLSKRRIASAVTVTTLEGKNKNRKDLARRLHTQVARLHAAQLSKMNLCTIKH